MGGHPSSAEKENGRKTARVGVLVFTNVNKHSKSSEGTPAENHRVPTTIRRHGVEQFVLMSLLNDFKLTPLQKYTTAN